MRSIPVAKAASELAAIVVKEKVKPKCVCAKCVCAKCGKESRFIIAGVCPECWEADE